MADDFGMGYALGQDSGGRNSEGFFGSEGIWAVIILAIIFGWGRNGFGGSGGGDQGALTRADLCSGFNFNNLDGAVRGVQQGLCDGFYAMNTSLLSGFHGVATLSVRWAIRRSRDLAALRHSWRPAAARRSGPLTA